MQTIKDVSECLLPLLGVLVLVALFIAIIEIIKLLKTTNETLVKTHGTIDLVDDSLKKVQEPLDSVVKVAKTVDKAHDATVKAVDDAKDYVVKNSKELKEKLTTIVENAKKEQTEEKIAEPSPEDML